MSRKKLSKLMEGVVDRCRKFRSSEIGEYFASVESGEWYKRLKQRTGCEIKLER